MLEWIVKMPNLLKNWNFSNDSRLFKIVHFLAHTKKNYHKSKTFYIWSYLGGCNYPYFKEREEMDSLIFKLLPNFAQSILGVVDLSDNGSDGGRLWVMPKSRYWSESFFPEIFRGDKRIVGWTFVSQNIYDCQLN